MISIRVLIAGTAARARQAKDELEQMLAEYCPGEHRPRQHRDGNKPWCDACGYTADGVQPVSEETRLMLRAAAKARAVNTARP